MSTYYVYFLTSIKNKKVYVGSTSKTPNERLREHNNGKNVWTKNNGPFELIYFEKYHCWEDAKSREKFYKMGFGKTIKRVIIETLNKSGFQPQADRPMDEAQNCADADK